jgi:alkylated DNA repair dioxygenase AlkB
LALSDADILIYRQAFSPVESDRHFTDLNQAITWHQDSISIFGKSLVQPRLTAWYGDRGKVYTYSGLRMEPRTWTPELLEIKGKVEAIVAQQLSVRFNSVLLNLYRTGQDSMGWHSDDEKELGEQPVIASVSFGATRRFQLKHKYLQELKRVDLDLGHGDLLMMQGPTQHYWKHQVPKTAKPVGPRINLTFRVIQT